MMREMWWSVLSVGLVISLGGPNETHGQAASPWLGQKVVTKGKAPLRVGQRIVHDGAGSGTYTVRQARGDWLWLVSDKRSGWARSSDVVGIDRAIAYFTDEIRRRRESADPYLKRGLVWSELGDQDRALADFADAMRLGRRDAYVYCLRGIG